MESQRDARKHPRADVRIPVDYHFGRVSGHGTTTNISQSGLFIPAEELAPAGSRIYLSLHFGSEEGGHLLQVVGVVVRVVEQPVSGGVERGMGVHFEVAVGRTREALAYFLGAVLERPDCDIVALEGESAQFAVRLSQLPPDETRPNVALSLENISGIFAYDAAATSSRMPLWLKLTVLFAAALVAVYAVARWANRLGFS